jgi:hypothetical protein
MKPTRLMLPISPPRLMRPRPTKPTKPPMKQTPRPMKPTKPLIETMSQRAAKADKLKLKRPKAMIRPKAELWPKAVIRPKAK